MVISFSFIVVVCNDTKKQNVLMTVVLSKRKSDGSSLEIPSPDEPRQVELESMPNLRLDPSLWMGRAFKFQGWMALLDVESEPTRVEPQTRPIIRRRRRRHQSAEARAQYGVNANVSRGFANNIWNFCLQDESQSLTIQLILRLEIGRFDHWPFLILTWVSLLACQNSNHELNVTICKSHAFYSTAGPHFARIPFKQFTLHEL